MIIPLIFISGGNTDPPAISEHATDMTDTGTVEFDYTTRHTMYWKLHACKGPDYYNKVMKVGYLVPMVFRI
jgi:hypothetical protein